MSKLLLFDIDGTLILTGGAGVRAMDRAFHSLFGVRRRDAGRAPRRPHRPRDPHRGRGDARVPRASHPNADWLDRFRAQLLRRARARNCRSTRPASACCRVSRPALAALARVPDVHLALADRELPEGRRGQARATSRSGTSSRSGRSATSPSTATRCCRSRWTTRAERGIGPFSPRDVFVIGDTPYDVACALSGGAVAVGVTTGPYDRAALEGAGADVVLPDLSDTGALLARRAKGERGRTGQAGPRSVDGYCDAAGVQSELLNHLRARVSSQRSSRRAWTHVLRYARNSRSPRRTAMPSRCVADRRLGLRERLSALLHHELGERRRDDGHDDLALGQGLHQVVGLGEDLELGLRVEPRDQLGVLAAFDHADGDVGPVSATRSCSTSRSASFLPTTPDIEHRGRRREVREQRPLRRRRRTPPGMMSHSPAVQPVDHVRHRRQHELRVHVEVVGQLIDDVDGVAGERLLAVADDPRRGQRHARAQHAALARIGAQRVVERRVEHARRHDLGDGTAPTLPASWPRASASRAWERRLCGRLAFGAAGARARRPAVCAQATDAVSSTERAPRVEDERTIRRSMAWPPVSRCGASSGARGWGGRPRSRRATAA